MIKCSITVADRNSMYMHQIITGYKILADKQKLRFTISENELLRKEFHHSAIIEVKIEGKRVIYDLTDGYNNFPSFTAFDNMLDNVDYYFKANFCEQFHVGVRNKDKIYVLAPRYYVTCSNSWLNKVDYWRMIRYRDIQEIKKLVHRFPYSKNANKNRYIKEFESSPQLSSSPKVFFYTRLWDPNIASAYSSVNLDLDGDKTKQRIERKKEEYAKVSELRASLVRTLKQEFGPDFIGGVAPSEYAKTYCPDLIGDKDMSNRRNYTKYMHMAEICVNTQGTHKCWNFSFGEELAASRAIVTQQPFYRVPEFLKEGQNFLTYSSVEQCIEQVMYLRSNKEQLKYIMDNNKTYYDEHLQPERLVLDTLEIVMR